MSTCHSCWKLKFRVPFFGSVGLGTGRRHILLHHLRHQYSYSLYYLPAPYYSQIAEQHISIDSFPSQWSARPSHIHDGVQYFRLDIRTIRISRIYNLCSILSMLYSRGTCTAMLICLWLAERVCTILDVECSHWAERHGYWDNAYRILVQGRI